MCQIPEEQRPKIFLRCLAQAVDPDDFVHVWGMGKWMSLYEKMCNEIPNVHILATNEEMVAHMRIANWKAPIYNISGLSFGKEEVQERVPNRKEFNDRKIENKNIYENIDNFISELVPLEDRRASGSFRQQLAGHLSRKVFKIAMENCDFEAS